MNVEETKRIIAIIESNFPSKDDDDSLRLKAAIWYESFKHIDYEEIHRAIFMVMQTSKFKPTIADINEILFNLNQNAMNEYEAWEVLRKEIKRGSTFTHGDFLRLPIEIQEIVKDGHKIRYWAMQESSYIEKHVMEDFLKRYRENLKNKKESLLLKNIESNRLAIATERNVNLIK